jgi:putative nucleotidyltransferase with HDIG domain
MAQSSTAANRIRSTHRVAIGAGLLASVVAITWLVLYSGGASSSLINLYYVPIVLAAFYLGDIGGLLVAIVAALAAGPLLPQDITPSGRIIPQTLQDILIRAGFFYAVALLTSRLSFQLQRKATETSVLLTVSQAISSTLQLDRVLETVAQKATELLGGRGCLIRLLDDNGSELREGAQYGLSEQYLQKGPVRVDSSPIDQTVLAGQVVAIRDVRVDSRFQYREQAAEEGLISMLCAPLMGIRQPMGVIRVYAERPRRFTAREREMLLAFANQASLAIDNARLLQRVEKNYYDTVRALTRAIEAKDASTLGHSERVVQTAQKIAEVMRLSREQRDSLRFGGILHDIGKIGLSDDALAASPSASDPGDPGDMLVRLHPLIGASILEPIEFLRPALDIVRYHHERWDGRGYPEGLQGEDIPLLARVIAVANAYEGLTGADAGPRLSSQDALADIERDAGRRYDPVVVKALASSLASEGMLEREPAAEHQRTT